SFCTKRLSLLFSRPKIPLNLMPTKTKNTIADTMKTASTNGKTNGQETPYQHHTLTSEDLEREYAFPVVPQSLDPIPDGAILTGPKADGSQSFKGNLKQ